MLKGKIHRATVTQAELNYVGSITVDEALMEAAGIREYEKVAIVDVNNGARYAMMTEQEADANPPRVVLVGANNKPEQVARYERHGVLEQ